MIKDKLLTLDKRHSTAADQYFISLTALHLLSATSNGPKA